MPATENKSFDTSMPTKRLSIPPPPSETGQDHASQPNLHRDQGSLTQSTYQGLGRWGTHCTQGSLAQEVVRSPAFLILFSLLFYITIAGRRKLSLPDLILSVKSIPDFH